MSELGQLGMHAATNPTRGRSMSASRTAEPGPLLIFHCTMAGHFDMGIEFGYWFSEREGK